MSASFTTTIRPACAPAALVCLTVLVGCGEPTPMAPEGPEALPTATAIVVDSDQSLLGVGTTANLAARAVDADGAPVEVELERRVADPAIATVSDDGDISALSVGTTEVTILLPGARHGGGADITTSVRITTVETAAGVVIVPSGAVTGDPEIVSARDADPLTGLEARITLSDGAPVLQAGDRVILSDWSFFGDVQSVTGSPSAQTVTIAASALDGFFEEARLRYELTLDDFDFLEVGSVPNALALTSGITGGGPASSAATSDSLFAEVFKDFDRELGKFKCSTSIDGSSISVDPQLDFDVRYEDIDFIFDQTITSGIGQDARFYAQVDFTTEVQGTLEWEETLQGRIECLAPVNTPVVQSGPFVIAFPTGVGFSLEASAASTNAVVTVGGHVDSSYRAGLAFSLAQLVEPINEWTHDFEALDVDVAFPSLTQPDAARGAVQLELFGFNALHAGVGIGVKAGIYKKLDMLYLGARLRTDVAGVERQFRDDGYAAQAALEAFAKRAPSDPLFFLRAQAGVLGFATVLEVLDAVGAVDVEELFAWGGALPISTSPTGTLVASPLLAEVGQPVTFALDLDAETFLGSYQVQSVDIYRIRGSGLSTETELVRSISPQPGQKHFEWSWTPTGADAEEGTARFAAAVGSHFFPIAIFQTDLPLSIDVVDPPPPWLVSSRLAAGSNAMLWWGSTILDRVLDQAQVADGQVMTSVTLTGSRPPDAPDNCSPVRETTAQADVEGSATVTTSGASMSYDLIATLRIRGEEGTCAPNYSVGASIAPSVTASAITREIEWTLTVTLDADAPGDHVIFVNSSAGSELEVRPGAPLTVSGEGTDVGFGFGYSLGVGRFGSPDELDRSAVVTVSLTATVIE